MARFSVAFALAGMLFAGGIANAQSSLFGNSGISSQSRSGSSSSLGGSALGGGMGGFGNAGAGGAMGGNSANGTFGGLQLSQQGSLGSTLGQGGFVGRGNASGRTIGMGGNTSQTQLGRGAQTQGFGNLGGLGARGQRTNNQGGNLGNNLNGFNQGGRNMGQQNQVTPIEQQQIRPQYRVAFDVPTAASVTLSAETRTRFDRIITRSVRGGNVQINGAEDGNVIIEGTVKTESDRRMIETLVRMEGSVRHVENHLVVQPAG